MSSEIDVLVCTTIIETGVDVPNCQHPHHRGRRPDGPVPALSAAGPGGPLQPPGLRLLHLPPGQGAHRSGGQAAGRHPGVHRSSAPASGSPCGTWRSAAPATSWAPSSTGTWRRSGYDMYLQAACPRRSPSRRARRRRRTTAECLVDIQVDAHIPEDYIDKPRPAAGHLQEDRLDPERGGLLWT